MRKVVVGAVAAAALAWAGGGQAADTKAEKDRPHATQPGAQSAGTAPGRETGAGGADRTSREMRSDARADQHAATQGDRDRSADVKHPVFDGKKNYDVDGKVKHASSDSITIERKDGLPPATLHVGAGTKIEVDGKRSSAANLAAGQDVKASFNLSGEKAEAVEIKADKHEGKDRRELGEQQRENRKEMDEHRREMQKEQQRK